MTGFRGLDREMCGRAWAIVRPSVIAAAEAGVTERCAGTILVARRVGAAIEAETPESAAVHVLFEGYIGSKSRNAEFTPFARAKLFTSLRTGLASRDVQQRAPHLLSPGMTIWGGSAVRDGVVAAFSGVESEYDEMFAEMMLSAIVGLCRAAAGSAGGLLGRGIHFIE